MNQKTENNQSIQILSDTLSSTELKEIFDNNASYINFELIHNNQVTRSPFADPTVIAALIGAGATTLASLIALVGVIWSSRQKDKKADDDIVIEVKIKKAALESIVAKNKNASNLLEGLNQSQTLQLPVGEAATVEDKDNPYHLILKELLPEAVEHVAILED